MKAIFQMILSIKTAERVGIFSVSILFLAACGSADNGKSDRLWKDASPAHNHLINDAIVKLEKDLKAPRYGNVNRLLIIHQDHVIADIGNNVDYDKMTVELKIRSHPFNYQDPNSHPYYEDTRLHTLQSVTKSVTSIAVGIAVTRGELGDVRMLKVMDFLEDDFDSPYKDAKLYGITLHDLLSMRAGLAPDSTAPTSDLNDTPFPLENNDDWVQFVFDQPMAADPGSAHDYSNGATEILETILQKVTNLTVEEYAKSISFNLWELRTIYGNPHQPVGQMRLAASIWRLKISLKYVS